MSSDDAAMSNGTLRRVLVSRAATGLHSWSIWLPRTMLQMSRMGMRLEFILSGNGGIPAEAMSVLLTWYEPDLCETGLVNAEELPQLSRRADALPLA